MKILNESISAFDAGGNRSPWFFYGEVVPSGSFFPAAPLMSLYFCVLSGSEALYARVGKAGVTADWSKLVHATGDFAISGTLTAGDVIISA